MTRGEDDGLRVLALRALGPLALPLAREALELGRLEVEPDVRSWQGSHGQVHAHLVFLWLEAELCTRVQQTPSAVDALTAAVASAVASVANHTLFDLKILPLPSSNRRSTAYRGRVQ